MVSGFLTLGGRLRAPDSVSDNEPLKEPNWPLKTDLTPVQDAMQLSSAKVITGRDKMVDHTLQIAIPIFRFAFLGCEAFFAFDDASNLHFLQMPCWFHG